MATSKRAEFLAGLKAELPLALGVIPFGMIYGVVALGAGLSQAAAQGMSSIIFAGSAQFISAQLFGLSAPAIIVVMTVAVVNLRHVLYSASLAPYVQALPARWKWLLAYLLTDEAYAVTITRYNQPDGSRQKHWFFLASGLLLWATWQASTAAGIFLGAAVPTSWSLDFTLALTFIGIVVPHLIRLMVGADHRLVLPASAFGGAAFVVACDTISRTALAPLEIPVGVVTAIIGGPFFLWLLIRNR